MFGLLAFHEIAARRGDGLRPELLRLLHERSVRGGLALIPGGLAETNQSSPLPDTAADGRLLQVLDSVTGDDIADLARVHSQPGAPEIWQFQ